MKKAYFILLACIVAFSMGSRAQSWTYNTAKPLLTSASQLSSNACSKQCESSEAHLIDGNIETYYHSSWSTTNGSPLPNAKHYLQWHLNEAQAAVIFTFTGMTWTSAHNSPKDVTILATNTPGDESSWVEITRLTNLTPDDIPSHCTSPAIVMSEPYTDMRMVVDATTTGNKEGTYGQQYFCLSEFQVYEAVSDNPAYARLVDLINKADAEHFVGGTEPGNYDTAKVEAFRQALADAKKADKDTPEQELNALYDALITAYDEVRNAIIGVSDGYYYIICTDSRFAQKKAILSDNGLSLNWTTLDEADPRFVFRIIPRENGNYYIQSFYSQAYVGKVNNMSTCFPLVETDATEQLITLVSDGKYRFTCAGYDVAYHLQDHAYGSGVKGNVIAWENAAHDFSLFALKQITDEQQLEQLAARRDKELAAFDSASIGVVFVGNSITYGATLPSPSTQSPPVIAQQLLADQTGKTVKAVNCGHSGSTTVDWLPGTKFLNEAITAGKSLHRFGSLWFNIMLGTNDSAETGPNGSPVSTSTYRLNLMRILGAIMTEFPDAKILLNYPIWYSPNTHNGALYKEKGLARLQSYHPIIEGVVDFYQSAGKPVYLGNKEAYTFFENNSSYFTAENGNSGVFYLHPNQQGAAKLADFWVNSIVNIIENDPLAVESVKWSDKMGETSDGKAVKLYTLDGKPVSADAQSPLSAGIYIVGNKKIAVK